MIPENSSPKQIWYGPYEGYEARIQHRGIGEIAAEAILHLRSQVVELQAHIHRLETELVAHESNKQMRLARYRKVYYEATWIELEFEV